ncbi:helix-turn-helix domain-containing protein [Alienimonas sp. DA493]|uniref:helix-turn-helix domain-containing protein n=1 Tax=Alienimonas sp. DA493 TaxID=3373605 RepID=UPI003754F1B7
MSDIPDKTDTRAKGRPERFRVSQVAGAIQAAGGVLTDAAEALGCSRSTVYEYLNRYPELRAVYDDCNEASLDVAESGLAAFINGALPGGDGEPQAVDPRLRLDAIKFYLRTKGKARGYGDALELSGAVGLAKLSDAELAEHAARLGVRRPSTDDLESGGDDG